MAALISCFIAAELLQFLLFMKFLPVYFNAFLMTKDFRGAGNGVPTQQITLVKNRASKSINQSIATQENVPSARMVRLAAD